MTESCILQLDGLAGGFTQDPTFIPKIDDELRAGHWLEVYDCFHNVRSACPDADLPPTPMGRL